MSLTLHTTLGDLKLEIYCDEVPRTATNFLALCASGYYDKTVFHRNIKGFMIQGGDPTGTVSFFITYKAHTHLNGKYTIFGHVIDGMDTLDKMERVPTAAGDRPIQEIRLNRVTLHANPLAQ
ncbi:hypothetical protein Ndes2526B_g04157 [Nannochloris sp. 'desiccata']